MDAEVANVSGASSRIRLVWIGDRSGAVAEHQTIHRNGIYQGRKPYMSGCTSVVPRVDAQEEQFREIGEDGA